MSISPADAVAARTRLERDLEQAGVSALRAFLARVVDLATGADGRPFSPATVAALWEPVVDALLAVTPAGSDQEDIRAALTADPIPGRAYQAALDLTLEHADPDTLAAALAEEFTIPARRGTLTAAGRRSRVRKSFDENPWIRRLSGSARTIATAAEGRATQYTLTRSGVPEKRWVARHDARTRTTHRVADGQTVPVDRPFIVGGFPMMYPGDRTMAPPEEYMQCRCVMTGVLAEFPDSFPVRRDQLPAPGRSTYSHAFDVHSPGSARPGKTEFPWSDPAEIVAAITDVTDHGTPRMRGNKIIIDGTHRGYLIRVIYDTYGGRARFRSAYPLVQAGPPGGAPIQRNPSQSSR